MKRYKDLKTEQLAGALEEQLKEQLSQNAARSGGAPSAEAAATGLSDKELFSFAGFDASEAERGGYSNYSYWRATLRVFFQKPHRGVFPHRHGFDASVHLHPAASARPARPADHATTTRRGARSPTSCPDRKASSSAPTTSVRTSGRASGRARAPSLFIGFTVACVEAVLGILMGVLWGYVRKLDFFFTELYNVCDNIPQTLLLILISYILNPGVDTIIFALCLTGWLSMARFIRNQIIIIRDRDYNLASRCLGTPTMRIVFKNLLPYLVSVITMRMALSIPSAIGNEVFVTYIGIGLPLDTPSLGNLIEAGRELMTIPFLRYQLYFPVAVLALITISFYVIGNAFADAADPKNHVK